MRKIITGIILGLVIISINGQAFAKWFSFGRAQDTPEIRNLFIGGVEVTNMDAKELALDRSGLDSGNIVIKGFTTKGEAPLAVAKVSLDGGQKWEDVPIRDDTFVFSFKPEEGQIYKPQFKVMDTAGKESDIGDIPQFNLIYKSVDLKDAVGSTLQDMIKAYSQKNLSDFSNYISDSFRGDVFALEEAIQSDFRRYDNINISITIQKVERSRDEVKVDFEFNWVGIKKSDGSILNPARGKTSYIFKQAEGGYKVLAMETPIIFGISEASEVSTASSTSVTDATSSTLSSQDTQAVLTIYTASLTELQSLDFSARTVGTDTQGDIYFSQPNGVIRVASARINNVGTGTLENFSTAPADSDSGWVTTALVTTGEVYALKDNDSNYGMFQITATGATLSFRYKYQTDGTRNLP